jgi:F-type H+-transporting ATPase subunit epsilon
MNESGMNLKISLPFRVFLNLRNVRRIVVETSAGSYGFLPHRLDCVAALVPGIFTYETDAGAIHYVAIDEGVLTKAGADVSVSVRNAIGGADLGKLRKSVEKEFMQQDAQEQAVRSVIKKMETSFIYRLEKLRQVSP